MRATPDVNTIYNDAERAPARLPRMKYSYLPYASGCGSFMKASDFRQSNPIMAVSTTANSSSAPLGNKSGQARRRRSTRLPALLGVGLGLFVFSAVYYQQTLVTGIEMNSHTWHIREFSFRRDPFTNTQLTGIRYSKPRLGGNFGLPFAGSGNPGSAGSSGTIPDGSADRPAPQDAMTQKRKIEPSDNGTQSESSQNRQLDDRSDKRDPPGDEASSSEATEVEQESTNEDSTELVGPSIRDHWQDVNYLPQRWDLVRIDGIRKSTGAAAIWSELLRIDSPRSANFWTEWTQDNPQRAGVFWPIAQELVAANCYPSLPALVEAALYQTDDAQFEGTASALAASALDRAAERIDAQDEGSLRKHLRNLRDKYRHREAE